MHKPKALDENKDPDPFWKKGKYAYKDPFDKFVPKGFISDMVYYFRGTEVPTVYTIWGALAAVSAVIKREAWLQWYPGEFYSNLYVILIGPAGGRKSTVVDFIIDMLRDYHVAIDDGTLREIKRLNIVKDKATPEAMLEAIIPKGEIIIKDAKTGRPILDENGKSLIYKSTSELVIGMSEMSVMINKQKYTESMIQNLLGLYDARGTWDWGSKGDGLRVLKNLYTTVLAATTPDGFANAVPRAAVGDGFLSRTIIANSSWTNRRFWQPIPPKGAPDADELKRRLAYIAQATQGTFVLTPEADAYGEEWYNTFSDERKEAGGNSGIISRQDSHLRKVAFLLKAQSYCNLGDNKINKADLERAGMLLRATYITADAAINEVKHGGTEFEDVYRVKDYIMERGQVTRNKLQSAMYPHRIAAERIQEVLRYLKEQGLISIWDPLFTEERQRPTRTKELYKYEGETIKEGTYEEDPI